MTPTEQDNELREEILNEHLIHEEKCSYSLYDEPCDCVQRDVSTNIMQLITADRKRVALEAKMSVYEEMYEHDYINYGLYVHYIAELKAQQEK